MTIKNLMMKKTLAILLLLALPRIAAATVYLSDGFESGNWSGSTGIGSWTDRTQSSVAISTNRAHSGTKSLKFTFVGNPDPNADAWAEQRFDIGANLPDLYIQYYIWFDSNYTIRNVGENNNKLINVWTDVPGNQIGSDVECETGMGCAFKAPIRWSNAMNDMELSCAGSVGYIPKAQSWTIQKGQWLKLMWHWKRDSGAGDGAYQLWVNDVLKINNVNQSSFGSPCYPGYWRIGYLMGWANSGFDETTSVYIDDIVISDTYISTGIGISPPQKNPSPVGGLKVE